MADQPSILLLLPYFGPLPASVDLFFRSCGENPTVNWLLITDQEIAPGRLPGNVRVKPATFAGLKASIDRALGFETTLPTAYKLCDFRPAFGLIFADDIAGFDFWGHCDVDVIFGNIRTFITDDVLRQYTKVLIHGHLSLYRNSEAANNYFRLDAPGVSFRDVFTSARSSAFDEFGGVRPLLNYNKIPVFRDDNYLADINSALFQFETMQAPNYRHQCFYWERGRVFKEFMDGPRRDRQEYMYIHLQKRRMGPLPADLDPAGDAFYITPRGFKAKRSDPVGPSDMDRYNPRSLMFDLKRYRSAAVKRLTSALLPARTR